MNNICTLNKKTHSSLIANIEEVIEGYFYHYYSIDMEEDRVAPTILVNKENELEFSITIKGSDETAKNLDIFIDNNNLIIRCHGRYGDKKHSAHQRRICNFERIIPLPSGVESEKAKVLFEKGEFLITIPKEPCKERRQLEIQQIN